MRWRRVGWLGWFAITGCTASHELDGPEWPVREAPAISFPATPRWCIVDNPDHLALDELPEPE